jgi:hypothetical protein
MRDGNPVEVEADRTLDGVLRPRAFHWEGRRFAVRSWGRTWDDDDGHHILVMVESGRVFELGYAPLTAAWRLIDRPTMFHARRRA